MKFPFDPLALVKPRNVPERMDMVVEACGATVEISNEALAIFEKLKALHGSALPADPRAVAELATLVTHLQRLLDELASNVAKYKKSLATLEAAGTSG